MSHLNGPRINFWGGGSTNVDTANNEQYDESGSALINLSDASVTPDMSDEAVINELRQTSTDSSGNPTYAKGGWNYYGDHQLKLMNATVSSSGYPGEVSTRSDLVGMPVYLLGGVDPESGDGPYGGPVMVDLDPSSGTTTQIYTGGLIVGNPNEPVLLIRGNTIGHSRMIGLRYNSQKTSPPYNTPGSAYASAIFQFAFAKSDIVSYDQQHPLLKAMIESPASQGVIIRFSMFQFYPGYSAQHMKANYESNQNDANPSLGRIIGSIGPWYEGELATEPPGRQLTNADLGGAQGLAYLNESTNLLTLDLVSALEGSAIRQDGHQNTSAPEPNVDYGNLLVNAGNNTIAQTPSLPNDYYLYGGIYDVPVSAAAIQTLKTHPLTLGSSKNNLQINETPLRITCDQRNIYLDPGASAPSIELIVEYLGQPVPHDWTLQLGTQSSGTLPDADFLTYPKTLTVKQGTRTVPLPVEVATGKDGFTQLTLDADQSAGTWISFRLYPNHDYSSVIQTGDVPWSLVYEECLRFYYVLFPAMSKRIPLNDESTIRAVGKEILKRTSAAYRDTTLYMPLTRSLSPGKIALLRAFLGASES